MFRPLITFLLLLPSVSLAQTVPASQLAGTGFVPHGSTTRVPALLLDVQRRRAFRNIPIAGFHGSGIHVGNGFVLTARHVWRDLIQVSPEGGYYSEQAFVGRKRLPGNRYIRVGSEPMDFKGQVMYSSNYGAWNDWALFEYPHLVDQPGLRLRSTATLAPGEALWVIGDKTNNRTRVSQGRLGTIKGVNGKIVGASLETGFSGGAVVDARGRVIGMIVTAFKPSVGGGIFVTVDAIAKQLAPLRPMGATGSDLNLPRFPEIGGDSSGGGGIVGTLSGSFPATAQPAPANVGLWLTNAKAPLQERDLLLKLAGSRIHTPADLSGVVGKQGSGSLVRASVLRGARIMVGDLTFGSRPPKPGSNPDAPRRPSVQANVLEGPPATGGVLLVRVMPAGPASAAGLRRGDVILQLGHRVVGGIDQLVHAIGAFKPDQTTQVVFLRGGSEAELSVRLD